ncbi:DASS family sodium-coupled anion symporter [Paremcibacter congregatus]|uniref:SLC13 family permease n=1 Tax=Paremcibacter congregatus TaxID=2043170 RepID=UPI0030EDAA71|tara:strand:+ start:2338 stop:3777 length:1440 start_codon:yes stop_codon:yes gene_type:complete
MTKTRRIGLLIGLFLFALTFVLPPPAEMSVVAWRTAGVALLLAAFWATEVLPIPITSLLPLLLFPALGVMPMAEAATPYARPTIFLLLGGFIIATALARWNLHRRLALNILVRVGNNPAALIGGFMAATALISMWISNTASSIMMIPIALSLASEIVRDQDKRHQGFVLCLILGIAYSASIGGLGTPIGTPPNLFVVSFMKATYGIEISFLTWMMFGIPTVLVMVPVAWFVLTKWAYPFNLDDAPVAEHMLRDELAAMGPMSRPERRVAWVFVFIAAAWILRVPMQQNLEILPWLNDAMIAVGGATVLFIIPSGCQTEKGTALLDWDTANQIPWGVLLLFGGGLSLAAAVAASGLAAWLGAALAAIGTLPLILIVLCLVAMVIFLTELTSNTATTATLLPVLGALAVSTGIDPMMLFAPVALSASCAFMLPVATAPNAVIYATGKVTIPQMAAAGFRLNLVGIVVITALSYSLVPLIFG